MRKRPLLMAAMLLLTAIFTVTRCLGQQPEQQPDGGQRGPADDPISELRLTPEQRQQIRAIRVETKGERAEINRRLREANRALEEALDSDIADEEIIKQRASEVAAAQAAQLRMRVLSEVRIRRVLTVEQRSLLRELRQARRLLRERPRDNRQSLQNGIVNPRRLSNQRNGLGPVTPRILNRRTVRP